VDAAPPPKEPFIAPGPALVLGAPEPARVPRIPGDCQGVKEKQKNRSSPKVGKGGVRLPLILKQQDFAGLGV
jgi:hypothetical protein